MLMVTIYSLYLMAVLYFSFRVHLEIEVTRDTMVTTEDILQADT